VPLSEHILPSPVDGRLNLGRPLAQSICGTLKVRWTAETPLLVGGANDENNKPFAINGTYAIPGASLKGMIRSVLEIAAFGRLTFYDDYVGYTRNTDGLRWHRTVPPEKMQGLEGRSGDAHPQRGGWLLRRWNGDRWEFRLVRADTRVFEIDRLVKILPGKVDRQAWHELSAQQRMQKLKDADLAGMIDTSRLLLLNTSGKGMIVVAGATPSVGQNMGTGKKTEALFIAQTRELDEICTKIGESFLASLQRDSNASQTEGSVPTALYDVLAQYGPAGFTEQKKPEKRSLSDKPAPEFEDQVDGDDAGPV
jgi:hypothetical protein